MDKRIKFLVDELGSGDKESMERAGTLICKSSEIEFVKEVMSLLKNKNPEVRLNAVMVLGVMGNEKALKKIGKLKGFDKDKSVRVAASIAFENFKKVSYQELKSKIKNEIIEKVYKKEIELPEKEKTEDLLEEEFYPYQKKSPLLVIIGISLLFIVFLLLIVYLGTPVFKVKVVPEYSTGVKKINQLIKERIKRIQDFKKDYLLPDGAQSRYPTTISLPTFFGDTYGEVAYRVYSAPEFKKAGMNTILAFWRKHNFISLDMERRVDLMELETDGEKLIFPNFSAMRIKFSLKEGSAANQAINKIDDDVEINVIVDKVVLK